MVLGGSAVAGPGNESTSFSLQCGGPDGDEVVAGPNGTGEGHDVFLLGIDEAEIRAAARKDNDPASPVVISQIAEMWCE
ncbi:hypothetical protein D3C83_129960 [compost metagenome]